MRRLHRVVLGLVVLASTPSLDARIAGAQTADVVVGVPIENGKAGRPQPGLLVDPNGRRTQREAVPAPVIVQDGAQGGTTTVRPNFGGGYTVENSNGKTTTVRPSFGGGYSVDQNGRTTQQVKPNFGGGYTVESSPGAPTTVVVPPPNR